MVGTLLLFIAELSFEFVLDAFLQAISSSYPVNQFINFMSPAPQARSKIMQGKKQNYARQEAKLCKHKPNENIFKTFTLQQISVF